MFDVLVDRSFDMLSDTPWRTDILCHCHTGLTESTASDQATLPSRLPKTTVDQRLTVHRTAGLQPCACCALSSRPAARFMGAPCRPLPPHSRTQQHG